MNILYVSSPLKSNYGGGEKFIENLVTNLPQHEHSFLGGSLALYKVFEKLGMKATLASAGFEPVTVKNLLLSPFSFILGLLHVFKFRNEFKEADIIVSPTSFTELFFVLPFVRILWNKPMVFIIQNNRFPKSIQKSPLLPILKWMWKKYPVVFMSEAQKAEWSKDGEIAKNSSVIHHGIPVSNLDIANWSNREEIHIGFLGRMHEEKGADVLLKALSKLEVNKKLIVHLAGEGEYLESLKALERDLQFNSNTNILWEGFVSPTLNFYNNLDLFVFPSRRESFGLVVAESWERGVPVLCSNLDVFLELKSLQENILEKKLVHILDDVQSLLKQIQEFIKNIDYWQSSGVKQEIRKTVLNNFQLESMAGKYDELFKKSIQK